MPYKLICMSFDGEYVTERPTFDTLEEVARYDNDLGSKWYFYPFHFPVTESGLTIVESFDPVQWIKGLRVSTVKRLFAEAAGYPENVGADVELFLLTLPWPASRT